MSKSITREEALFWWDKVNHQQTVTEQIVEYAEIVANAVLGSRDALIVELTAELEDMVNILKTMD